MQINITLAPGAQLNGQAGARMLRNLGRWLHSLPPWRVRGVSGALGVLLAVAYVPVWLMELDIWLGVWFYYGAFLALRWFWRNNLVGNPIDGRAARRERRQAVR